MKARKPGKSDVVRNRRIIIYTIVLILALNHISAYHSAKEKKESLVQQDLEKESEVDMVFKEAAVVPEGKPDMKSAVSSETESGLVIYEEELWSLILTNAEYPVPEDYQVVLKQVPGTDQMVDERMYPFLMEMLEAMEAEGLSPEVCSGYRTLDKQEKLFNRKLQMYVRNGYTKDEAYTLTRQTLSIPGSGEHCLGLAVDFYTRDYHQLEQAFEETPEGIWLREHGPEYGFILRYDRGKEEITGIQYEPWHFRYVGAKAAMFLKEKNLSLEEFYIEESLYG